MFEMQRPTENQEVTHMNMIQGVINRLAGNSSKCKEMAITLTAAILTLAATNKSPDTLLIAYGIIVLFWFLDSYYLGLERQVANCSKESQQKIANGTFSIADLYVVKIKGRGFFGFKSALSGFVTWATMPIYLAMLVGVSLLKLYFIR